MHNRVFSSAARAATSNHLAARTGQVRVKIHLIQKMHIRTCIGRIDLRQRSAHTPNCQPVGAWPSARQGRRCAAAEFESLLDEHLAEGGITVLVKATFGILVAGHVLSAAFGSVAVKTAGLALGALSALGAFVMLLRAAGSTVAARSSGTAPCSPSTATSGTSRPSTGGESTTGRSSSTYSRTVTPGCPLPSGHSSRHRPCRSSGSASALAGTGHRNGNSGASTSRPAVWKSTAPVPAGRRRLGGCPTVVSRWSCTSAVLHRAKERSCVCCSRRSGRAG
ncbi:hypothetical protein C8D88_10562 [Lentzea atacamensis]|uniref:Uncharacterized protein n=1 Tax=Lentzea atacamensis TaxID=531938 RepID=A0A316IFG9_9PSEU|nr:hypothetical protein C8D88_10562 [Lentzea atacamensis]